MSCVSSAQSAAVLPHPRQAAPASSVEASADLRQVPLENLGLASGLGGVVVRRAHRDEELRDISHNGAVNPHPV